MSKLSQLAARARYLIIIAISAIGLFAIIGSGATPRYTTNTYEKSYYYNENHEYEISVVDIDDKPVPGVSINYKAYDVVSHKKILKTDGVEEVADNKVADTDKKPSLAVGGLITDGNKSKDVFKYKVKASPDNSYSSWVDFKTALSYEAVADGYYSKSGELTNDYGSVYKGTSYSAERSKSTDRNPVKTSIKMYKPIDYFAPEFILLDKDDKLKQKIYKFLDAIKIQGYLSNAYLKYRSINSTEFKGKKYIRFEFDSSITYNSLKLNKYDIAKNLFDDVIRKILNPLNDNISDPKRFYGYDLTVIGNTKSFADEYASAKPIVYRFYIPENAVKSYKDKDISGQQLIDKSVILMDDERIDLKLQ